MRTELRKGYVQKRFVRVKTCAIPTAIAQVEMITPNYTLSYHARCRRQINDPRKLGGYVLILFSVCKKEM